MQLALNFCSYTDSSYYLTGCFRKKPRHAPSMSVHVRRSLYVCDRWQHSFAYSGYCAVYRLWWAGGKAAACLSSPDPAPWLSCTRGRRGQPPGQLCWQGRLEQSRKAKRGWDPMQACRRGLARGPCLQQRAEPKPAPAATDPTEVSQGLGRFPGSAALGEALLQGRGEGSTSLTFSLSLTAELIFPLFKGLAAPVQHFEF